MKTYNLILLFLFHIIVLGSVSVSGQTISSVKGRIEGASQGHGLSVILSNENMLLDVSPDSQNDFIFENIEQGEYVLKVNGVGYDTGLSQTVTIGQPEVDTGSTDAYVFNVSKLTEGGYRYKWKEDASPAGAEYSSYVNKPVEVEIFGVQETIPQQNFHPRLWEDYAIVLSDDQKPWNQEFAYRLLETLDQLFIAHYDPLTLSKWILSDDHIDNDMTIRKVGTETELVISRHAFTHAAPMLAKVEGKRGKYYSKRLHHACVRFVTEEGTNASRAEQILINRFGVRISGLDYETLTKSTTVETADRFQDFHAEELIQIINTFEEMPEGFHKIPNLKFLLRRKTGHDHPLYPSAPAVAWTSLEEGYIEFVDIAFTTISLEYLHRLIIHEKAHFVYSSLLSDELRNKWFEIGGWYENVNDPDGWSTTKTTEFVSAYAHKKNPNEDFAESVSYFVINPDKLRSRALAKYEFIRDYIMQGTIYLSKIREDLTFEVLNLFPDYDYPGKIKSVDVLVEGEPEEDKTLTLTIELHTMPGILDGATQGFLRLTSEVGTFKDMYINPVDENGASVQSGSILKGSIEFSKYAKAGFWHTDQITIKDAVGNERHSGVDDFGWRLYLDNPLEDVDAPAYVKDSITTTVEDDTLEGRSVSLLKVEWVVDENKNMNAWANCYVSLLPPGEDAYRLESYGYAVDDQNDGYDTTNKKCRVDFVIPEFYRTGAYSVQSIKMMDQAGNQNVIYFSEKASDEPPVFVTVITENPDITAPELDLNKISVSAEPTNPLSPNGETIVTFDYDVRDDISGLGKVSYHLRDPQGVDHNYFHYHDNFYSTFFEGDPLSWVSYQDSVVLPVGSAPGFWGVSELYLQDKANNFKVYDFTETIRFDLLEGSSSGADTLSPVLTLNGDATITIYQDSTFGNPGAAASDNIDGDLTSNIVVSGSVDTSSAGTYTLKYDVSDAAGNAAESVSRTVVVEKATVLQTLDLKTGWNLISFYVESEDMTPSTVLESIKGNLLQIKNLKSSYDPALPPFLNTLKGLNVKDGYWVSVDAAVSFDLEGEVPAGASITVKPGWNLVGYPRESGAAPGAELTSLGGIVEQFKNLKSSYDPALPPFLNTLKVIAPGLGYWLKVSADGVWNVGDESGESSNRDISKMGPDDKSPDWGQVVVYPNVGATVLAEVFIIGDAVMGGSVVGAFVGDELRGQQEVVLDDGRSYVAINVNLAEAEKVSFRIWDAGNDKEYGVTMTMTLEMGEMYGTAEEFVKLNGVASGSGITIRIVGYEREPFGFGFESQNGLSYVVEATDDWKEWGTLKTYNGTGTMIRFEDERDQVFPQIYYRVRVVE
jgi:hypothetical protein